MTAQFLLLQLDGSRNEEKSELSEKRLKIGPNLLSVGVKWYLISRMASKSGSHFLLSSPLPFPK